MAETAGPVDALDAAATIVGPVTGLSVLIDGVWRDPVSVVQGGPTGIWATYDTEQTLESKSYRIVVTPTGIAQGSGIVLPQGGMIEAP